MRRLTLHVAFSLLSFLVGLSAARAWDAIGAGHPFETVCLTGQVFSPASVTVTDAAEQEILDIIRRYDEAQTRHDADFFRSIEADSFVLTDGSRTLTREQAIAEMLTWPKDVKYTSDDLHVQFYGGAAIVTGRMTETPLGREGAYGISWRWVDVFVKRDGRWQIISTVVD